MYVHLVAFHEGWRISKTLLEIIHFKQMRLISVAELRI